MAAAHRRDRLTVVSNRRDAAAAAAAAVAAAAVAAAAVAAAPAALPPCHLPRLRRYRHLTLAAGRITGAEQFVKAPAETSRRRPTFRTDQAM
jgi:hypothetical protein